MRRFLAPRVAILTLGLLVGCAPGPGFELGDMADTSGLSSMTAVQSTPRPKLAPTPTPVPTPTPEATPTPEPTPTPTPTPKPTLRPSGMPDVQGRDPNSYFVCQNYSPEWNLGAPKDNNNCGPSSLLMVTWAYGLLPPDATTFSDVQAQIRLTRKAMTGDTDDFKTTKVSDQERGASVLGLKHERVYGISGVLKASAEGKYVILPGNLDAYNKRFGPEVISQGSGPHSIVLTRVIGDRVFVNDPLSYVGNLEITMDELKAYIGYENWNMGLALFK